MAEFNPYKLEEEKWTPNNVYEILPPNAVSWSDYEFGQGTDNVNQEAANKSLIDGFVDFFKELFGTAGKILAGAVEVGGVILGGFVKGVAGLIGGIAKAIGSIFRGSGESPNLPLFNPIKTNLEAAIQPQRDKINESLQRTEEILAEQLVLRGQMDESLQDMRDARDRANEAIEKSGQSIAEAQAASDAAEAARQTLEEYNTALNKRITTEFNSAVGRANTAVEKADTLAGELADFKAQHQREINDAVGKAEKAVADLAALSPKVDDAVAKANKATSDVSTLTPKVTAAQNKADSAYTAANSVRDEVTPKIEAAQTKGENALAIADKAVGWLKNPVEIGSSLIALDVETKEPHYLQWAGQRMSLSSIGEVPESVGVKQTATEPVRRDAPTDGYVLSKLNKGTVYRWSVWVYSSVANSDIRFLLKDPVKGLVTKRVWGDRGVTVSNSKYGIVLTKVPKGWSKQSGTIEFEDKADYIYLYAVEWNMSNTSVTQYFAGLDIYPDVPTQASVDQAQNDAIKANQDILRQQGEINEAQRVANLAQKNFNDNQTKWNNGVTAALDAQKKVNDNFKKWTDGATEAIEANKNAIKALNAPTNASSALPLIPGTSAPTWTEGLTESTRSPSSTADADLPPNITKLYSSGWVGDKSQKTFPNPHNNLVTVNSRIEYEASWWIRATRGGTHAYITLCDENGDRFIVEKLPATELDSNPSQYTWGNPIRALITPPNGSGWTKFTTRFKFKEGVTKARVYDINFVNTNNDYGTTYYIADLQINPAIPSQASVDKAQNDAIAANTEALKALGKKVLGASLVPYKTPSTQEVRDYAAGKLNYDPWADPEYFNAAHSIASPSRGRVARANAGQGTRSTNSSYVPVDSSIEYKVKFHTWASGTGSKLFINMYDQDGELAVAATPFTDSGSGSGDLIKNLTLPNATKYWSGVIRFNSKVTHVKLGNFYWNHPSGTQGLIQEFGGLEIVPNIPDANVVNELQDNAIRKNTQVGSANKKAIEALKDGLNASIELGEVNQIVGNLRDELEEEAKKREALQEKIDALQTEMIPRTIVSDDRVTYDDYVSLNGNTVTAKGSWAGQLAVTYIENASGAYKTRVTRKSVPDGTTRSWKIWDSIQRVDYWVYQGRQRTILLKNTGAYITGSTFSKGTWSVLATHKVGKTYGTGKIEWRANLLYADRNATYRFAIEVNGTTVKNVVWTNIGPLTPLGDGMRTLRFEHEFNLPDDATVRILGYISGGGSQQAKVTLLQGTLVYVQDTAREG